MFTLLAFLILLGAASLPASESPVIVRLRGGNAFAPATVIVSARIEKHAWNREVCAAIDEGIFATQSCRPHVGTDAPTQVIFEPFRDLPEGEYTATVYVNRQNLDTGKWERVSGFINFRILAAFGA
jgi:hypothetical protein